MNITTVNRPMLEELLALTVPGEADDEPVEVTLRRMDDGPDGPGLYAYYTEYPEEGVTLIDGKSEVLRAEGRASLTGAQPAPAAPSGYKLVPLEPTPDMVTRAENVVNDPIMQVYRDEIADVYRAMLSAAPAAQPAAYQLLGRRDIIRPDDEVLADDTVTWLPLVGWEVGNEWGSNFMPMRRQKEVK